MNQLAPQKIKNKVAEYILCMNQVVIIKNKVAVIFPA